MARNKRSPLKKDQILADLRRKQEINRKRAIVVDQFYPALVEATISVDEAKMLIQAISTTLMEEVLTWMQQRPFTDILPPLLQKLCPGGEREQEIAKLLKTVDGENVYVAREIIEGMSRALEQMTQEKMREIKLSDLSPKWESYLN